MCTDGILYYKQEKDCTMLWKPVLYRNLEINLWYDYTNKETKKWGQCRLKDFNDSIWHQKPQNWNENTIFLEFLGRYVRQNKDKGVLEADFEKN